MMKNWHCLTRDKVNPREFVNIVIDSCILSIFFLFIFLCFIYTVYEWRDQIDKSANLGMLPGLLGIFIGLYSLISTTKQLNNAEKQLGVIQADYWIARGIDQYGQNKFNDAGRSYKRAFDIDSNDVRVWINFADSLHGKNKLDEALDVINKAIDLNPRRADAWNNKGIILFFFLTNTLQLAAAGMSGYRHKVDCIFSA
ncbi:MAG: tetratricopeptide repeat protein [Methanotrichaceae archaeon]